MHSGCVCSTGNSIFTGHVNPSSTTSSAVKIKSQAHDLDSPKSAAVVCEPGDDLSRRMSEEINPGSLEHLLQLDPGWGLCSMIWHGVDPLERSRRSGRSFVNDSVRKGGLHLTFKAHANLCVVSFLYCCINLLVLFLLISHDQDFFLLEITLHNLRYSESIQQLRLVLSSPFLGPSRGAMYNRLALDLQV